MLKFGGRGDLSKKKFMYGVIMLNTKECVSEKVYDVILALFLAQNVQKICTWHGVFLHRPITVQNLDLFT